MNILVSAAALRASGARTIYRQFIEHLRSRVDGNRYYVMVDKCMEMPEIDGVSYWIVDVSSKWKRIWFELFGFKQLVEQKDVKFDVAISLQNLGIRQLRNLPQVVYYHQSLPFFDYKWNICSKRELMMWSYKHLYPIIVKLTIAKSTDMIAQLPSIKDCIVCKYGLASYRVHVLFPDLEKINIGKIGRYPFDERHVHFLFPATSAPYKGHRFLVDVMSLIKKQDPNTAGRVKIHFTLDKGQEHVLVNEMVKLGVEHNFEFHGVVPHDVLLSMYKSSSCLLFPSVVETLGLPLIESACFGIGIIACDLKYAREVLAGYEWVTYLESRTVKQWADAIIKVSKEPETYRPLKQEERSSWEDFFDIVDNTSNNRK